MRKPQVNPDGSVTGYLVFALMFILVFRVFAPTSNAPTPERPRTEVPTRLPAGFFDAVATIIAESRGQPVSGQIAVAHVIKNRVGAYPAWTDLGKVVRASGYAKSIRKRVYQFEPWQTRVSEMRNMRKRHPAEFKRGAVLLVGVLNGTLPDPVADTCGAGNSFYFIERKIVLRRYGKLPPFARQRTRKQIGDHTFYCKN